MITVHGSLSPLWATAAAITLHALAHLGHLVENVKMRRELARRRRPAPAAPVPSQPTREETPQ